jgi:type III pantothenate kinase
MIQKTDTNVIIDLGNTLFKVAVFEKNMLLSIRVFKNGSYNKMGNYLKMLPRYCYCILSSVVNYPDALQALLDEHFKTIILNPETAIPIGSYYKTPDTLGKDRIAAAVAAWHSFPGKNLLVIDAGTALTMDFVSADGNFIGGAISPGIDMRFKALHTFTGKLPLVKRKNIKYLTGATTEESISTGVINGITAEIDGIIDNYKLNYPDLTIIFGGGDSKFLHKRLKNSIFALPNPVINGLQIILNYNIENKKLP